jgi:hypothetical protein
VISPKPFLCMDIQVDGLSFLSHLRNFCIFEYMIWEGVVVTYGVRNRGFGVEFEGYKVVV